MNKNMLTLMALVFSVSANATVLTFDDLLPTTDLTGSNYAGFTWEMGAPGMGYSNNTGYWCVPPLEFSYPIGVANVINCWGATSIGISLNKILDVDGAYIASQGAIMSYAQGVRVHGYLGGVETSVTDWFYDIDPINTWFAMNLTNVDRIVFETLDAGAGGGWFGMDDFTYTVVAPVPVPAAG